VARAEESDRFVLPIVLVGTFMAILDVAIVNVAIPSIRAGLNAASARWSWWCPGTPSPTPRCW
jgi:hypothetical protein